MARAKRRHRYSDDENEIEMAEQDAGEEVEHVARETADTARRQFQRFERSAFSLDIFGSPMARLMDHNWSMFQKIMHAMREESFQFVNRRLDQTTQAIESSRESGGISNLLAIQQEWIVNFVEDYAEQTKRFAEMVRDLAEEETSNISRTASEVTERGREAVETAEQRRAA
ncbi:MAG TPA: hypothetical protein VGK90_07565 [Rhizomicrobium sp.]|jgi:hypothetical protein